MVIFPPFHAANKISESFKFQKRAQIEQRGKSTSKECYQNSNMGWKTTSTESPVLRLSVSRESSAYK